MPTPMCGRRRGSASPRVSVADVRPDGSLPVPAGPATRHHDALADHLAFPGLVGIAEGERRRVGLERAVRPVALVLHLEEVALEGEAHGRVIVEVDLELFEGREERVDRAVPDLLGADEERQLTLDRPAGRPGPVRAPRAVGRMQHAEADPAVEEVGFGDPVQLCRNGSFRSLDRALPAEVDLIGSVPRLEADREPIARRLDLQPGDLGRDRVPLAVADRDVEAADDLRRSGTAVAEVGLLELELDRAGAHETAFDRRLVPPVPELVPGRQLRHRIRSDRTPV